MAIVALCCIFSGCSQEDEYYYDSEMFTRAEGMMARNGEGNTGGNSEKKGINFTPIPPTTTAPTGFSQTINIATYTNFSSSSSTLFGEYDHKTLSVSISNYAGNASLYICSVQGNHLMGSATLTVENSASQDFSLTGFSTGQSYQIYVILDNAAYVGNFEL